MFMIKKSSSPRAAIAPQLPSTDAVAGYARAGVTRLLLRGAVFGGTSFAPERGVGGDAKLAGLMTPVAALA